MKIIGIYKIINRINEKYYVGSSNNVIYRMKYRHKMALKENRHWNSHLQNAWNMYGERAFDFVIVERFDSPKSYTELWAKEQKWLNIAKTEVHKCYNQSFIAGGVDFTPEVRHKMSISTKQRLKKNGHPLLGTHPSQKTLRKMSESHKGIKLSESAKLKISGINSVAHRQNVKDAKRNWWNVLKQDPIKYAEFCKSRGEKSREAKLHYGKNYEIISD